MQPNRRLQARKDAEYTNSTYISSMKKLLLIMLLIPLMFLGCKKEPTKVNIKINIDGGNMRVKVSAIGGEGKMYYDGGASSGASITASVPKGRVLLTMSTENNGCFAKVYNSSGVLIKEIYVIKAEPFSQGLEVE